MGVEGPQWCKKITLSRVYLKWLLSSAGPFVRTISRRKRGSVRQGTGDTFPLKQTEVAAVGMEARVLIEAFRSMPTQAKCSLCLAMSVDRALNQMCQQVWVQSLFGNYILWRYQTEEEFKALLAVSWSSSHKDVGNYGSYHPLQSSSPPQFYQVKKK